MPSPITNIRIIPSWISWNYREDGEWITKNVSDIFSGKKVVMFALPGAFTPTCTSKQLPGYEKSYSKFKKLGIDEVYCLSVNDSFVMNAWFKELKIKNVKYIPDGNAVFTKWAGMDVLKENLGFGVRSWRYACVVDDGVISSWHVEDNKKENAEEDPYEFSSPETLLAYLKH